MSRTSAAAPGPKKKVVRKKASAIKRRVSRSVVASVPSIAHGHAVHEHREVRIKTADSRNQKLVIWVGAATVMTLILIAWIINLRSVLGPDVEASAKPKTASEIDFEKFKNELNDTMNDVKDNLRDFKEIGSELVTDTAAPDPSASALDKFRDRLEAGQSPSTSAVTPATLPE